MNRRVALKWMGSSIGSCVLGARGLPANMLARDVPEPDAALRARVRRYTRFQPNRFLDWHPAGHGMLVTTRAGETLQLHEVRRPGARARALTAGIESVRDGDYRPGDGAWVVFRRDRAGDENDRLIAREATSGRWIALTPQDARCTGWCWAPTGRWLAYATTMAGGEATRLSVVDPARPGSARMVASLEDGRWSVLDVAPDETCLLLERFRSLGEMDLFLLELETGTLRTVGPSSGLRPVRAGGRFCRDGKSVMTSSDQGNEFRQLMRWDLESGRADPVGNGGQGDVEGLALEPGGPGMAWVTNEAGRSVLRWQHVWSGEVRRMEGLPSGVYSDLRWRPGTSEVGLTVHSVDSPGDAYSVDLRSGSIRRWTTGCRAGTDASNRAEPENVRIRSFDGLELSAWWYRPSARRHPGPRPVLISFHGGPESEARPEFQGRWRFLLEERGVALLYPNVRGSTGRGRRFQGLDDGVRREDAIRDVGAVLDWLGTRPELDAGRVAVHGASYGGYLALMALAWFGDRIRCGVDVAGITSLPEFLRNTRDDRRDLRRAEYGDERDPAAAAFLDRFSPLGQVDRLARPVLVVHGTNDPRVPVDESRRLVDALRRRGRGVWQLEATDEGHGFGKRSNAELLFLTLVRFLDEHLLR